MADGYLMFVSKPTGYVLVERDGDPPLLGTQVENGDTTLSEGDEVMVLAPPERAGCPLAAHIAVPKVNAFTNPLLYAVPVQLLAYHTAVFMGTDVDQPRNLAKSVTVE